MSSQDFRELLSRVRSGDAQAAEELLKSYDAELKIIVRAKLRDSRLRKIADSIDICQSVLGNFFVRAANGQFDLNSPEDLIRLLATMARNKVLDLARSESAQKRDSGRVHSTSVEEIQVQGKSETPSVIVSNEELLESIRQKLPADVAEIQQMRIGGHSWDQIAEQRGESAEAIRKHYSRSMDKICAQLGIK